MIFYVISSSAALHIKGIAEFLIYGSHLMKLHELQVAYHFLLHCLQYLIVGTQGDKTESIPCYNYLGILIIQFSYCPHRYNYTRVCVCV